MSAATTARTDLQGGQTLDGIVTHTVPRSTSFPRARRRCTIRERPTSSPDNSWDLIHFTFYDHNRVAMAHLAFERASEEVR